jgi:hypothetical protein
MVAKGPILSLVLLAVAACFLGPADRVTGQWGGDGIGLDARNSEVQLQFPCMKAALPELGLDAAGHFEGTAQVTSGRPWTSVHVSGEIDGANMMMAVTYIVPNYPSPEPEHYALRRSATPDFSKWGCLK